MLQDVIAAEPGEGYLLHLRFEDGTEGVIDLEPWLSFRGIFAPLKDPSYFRRVRVDPESGTVVWPNGADLDPDVLYARLTGQPIKLGLARNNATSAPHCPKCEPAA